MTVPHAVRPERRLSLGFRRFLVVSIYGCYAAYAGLMAVPGKVWTALAIAFFVAGLLALWGLFHRTNYWNWGNAPDGTLDEREVAVRNRAYRLAYSAFTGTALLTGFYFSVAVEKSWLWKPATYDETSRLVWAFLLLGMTLPSAILAWDDRPVEE